MSNLNLKGLWIPIEILTDKNLSVFRDTFQKQVVPIVTKIFDKISKYKI